MAKEEKTLDEMFQELDKLIQAMEEPEILFRCIIKVLIC